MEARNCKHKPNIYRPIIVRSSWGINKTRICKRCGKEIVIKNYDRFMKPLRIVRTCGVLFLFAVWFFVVFMANRPILYFYNLKSVFLSDIIALLFLQFFFWSVVELLLPFLVQWETAKKTLKQGETSNNTGVEIRPLDTRIDK